MSAVDDMIEMRARGYSVAAIAQKLAIKPGSVSSVLSRARKAGVAVPYGHRSPTAILREKDATIAALRAELAEEQRVASVMLRQRDKAATERDEARAELAAVREKARRFKGWAARTFASTPAPFRSECYSKADALSIVNLWRKDPRYGDAHLVRVYRRTRKPTP